MQCFCRSVQLHYWNQKPSPKINTSDNGPFSSLNMPPVLCYPPFSWQFTSSIHHKTSYSRRKRGQMSESKHRGLSIFQADLTSTSPSLSPFCHVQSFDGGCRPWMFQLSSSLQHFHSSAWLSAVKMIIEPWHSQRWDLKAFHHVEWRTGEESSSTKGGW